VRVPLFGEDELVYAVPAHVPACFAFKGKYTTGAQPQKGSAALHAGV
jgi:hypothetical protein